MILKKSNPSYQSHLHFEEEPKFPHILAPCSFDRFILDCRCYNLCLFSDGTDDRCVVCIFVLCLFFACPQIQMLFIHFHVSKGQRKGWGLPTQNQCQWLWLQWLSIAINWGKTIAFALQIAFDCNWLLTKNSIHSNLIAFGTAIALDYNKVEQMPNLIRMR